MTTSEKTLLPVAQAVYQEPSTLPTVQVSMDGAHPIVTGTSPPVERPRRGVIVTALSPEFELDAQGVPRRRTAETRGDVVTAATDKATP